MPGYSYTSNNRSRDPNLKANIPKQLDKKKIQRFIIFASLLLAIGLSLNLFVTFIAAYLNGFRVGVVIWLVCG